MKKKQFFLCGLSIILTSILFFLFVMQMNFSPFSNIEKKDIISAKISDSFSSNVITLSERETSIIKAYLSSVTLTKKLKQKANDIIGVNNYDKLSIKLKHKEINIIYNISGNSNVIIVNGVPYEFNEDYSYARDSLLGLLYNIKNNI